MLAASMALIALAAACMPSTEAVREEQRVGAAEEVVEQALERLPDGELEGAATEVLSALAENEDDDLPFDEDGDRSFLETLGKVDGASSGVAAMGWRSSQGIVETGEAVLSAYEGLEGAGLVTGGYLDLQGRTWGAVVLLDGGFVDIVVVAAEEDDAGSCVRAVRLSAEGLAAP